MNNISSIRLDKLLSSQLNISRTDAKKLLKQGGVTVNGETIKSGDRQIFPETDRICAGGREICYKEHLYIMMNKPQGVVSASVGRGDVTVVDILPPEFSRPGLFPAGRLDKDTTGFVLITDDGGFAHNILSPAKHVPKTYIVTPEHPVSERDIALFSEGMLLGDEKLQPAVLKKLPEGDDYMIVLRQGLYHQIKRMFLSVGNRVTALKRIAIGGLLLDNSLQPGQCREITAQELALIVNGSFGDNDEIR